MKPTTNIDPQEREWLLKEKYGGAESDAFCADLARLAHGEPIAYVIGFSKFLGCHIDLSYKPLIPRTETEYWVEQAIQEIQNDRGADAPLKILDIFSGSGCIGIAAFSRLPNASVDFTDLDPKAIKQIRKNLELNDMPLDRSNVYESDVFSRIPEGKTYDVIFANPPYIGDRTRPDANVLTHEPHQALFAEENGLALVRQLLEQVHSFLAPAGRIYIEHDHDQQEAITQLLQKNGFTEYAFHTDQFGLTRWLALSLF